MSGLPSSWIETVLEDVCDVIRGITFPSSAKESKHSSLNVCCLRTSNIQREIVWNDIYFVPQGFVKRDDQYVKLGDILMSMANSYELVGKVAVVKNVPYSTAFGAFLSAIRPKTVIYGQFLFHLLRTAQVQSELRRGSSQTVNIANISGKSLSSIQIPLAPLNEQKRIADKLDQLLSTVDCCKARLDTIPFIIKRFRQSVLAAATSGELTADWRSSNTTLKLSWIDTVKSKKIDIPKGIKRLSKQAFKPVKIEHSASGLPATWHITTVGELYKLNVLIDFADGNHGGLYPRKEDFSDKGALFLTASQIGEAWELDLDSCPLLKFEKARELTKGWAQADDVLLTHNATVGRVALLEGIQEKVLLGTSATFYRFNADYIQPRFARILFSSPFFQRQLESEMQQTTRNQVPITKQVSINFICPPVEEQKEIIRRVEALFITADHFLARYQATRSQVDQLTPSILAKAFRGELVQQNPNDEPAGALLERLKNIKLAEPERKHKMQSSIETSSIWKKKNMKTKSTSNLAELVAVLATMSDESTPEKLIAEAGLIDNVELFYELLREGRDLKVLDVPVGTNAPIRRLVDATR